MQYNSKIVFLSIVSILFVIFIVFTVRKAKANALQKKKGLGRPQAKHEQKHEQQHEQKHEQQHEQQQQPNILDRQYLERENPSLLPANEIQQTNYKDWNTTAEKEIYSSDAPLFNQQGPINLVTPDINSTQRRVNFY